MASKTRISWTVYGLPSRFECKDSRVLKELREWCKLGCVSCFLIVFRSSTWWAKYTDGHVTQRNSETGCLDCGSTEWWYVKYDSVRVRTPIAAAELSCPRERATIKPSAEWGRSLTALGTCSEWVGFIGSWTRWREASANSSTSLGPISGVIATWASKWKSQTLRTIIKPPWSWFYSSSSPTTARNSWPSTTNAKFPPRKGLDSWLNATHNVPPVIVVAWRSKVVNSELDSTASRLIINDSGLDTSPKQRWTTTAVVLRSWARINFRWYREYPFSRWKKWVHLDAHVLNSEAQIVFQGGKWGREEVCAWIDHLVWWRAQATHILARVDKIIISSDAAASCSVATNSWTTEWSENFRWKSKVALSLADAKQYVGTTKTWLVS